MSEEISVFPFTREIQANSLRQDGQVDYLLSGLIITIDALVMAHFGWSWLGLLPLIPSTILLGTASRDMMLANNLLKKSEIPS